MQTALERERAEALMDSYTTQRRLTHEFTNHIEALTLLLQQGEYEEAKAYLATIEGVALGSDALSKAIELIEKNQIKPVKQVGESSYAPMIDKSISRFDWNKSAFEIHNKIRGLQSWPAASAGIGDKEVKIHKSVLSQDKGARAGEVICCKGRLTVS